LIRTSGYESLVETMIKANKRPYWGNHFWTESYGVDSVGLDSEMIRKYVKYQEVQERRFEQRGLF
jgi:putative transposase